MLRILVLLIVLLLSGCKIDDNTIKGSYGSLDDLGAPTGFNATLSSVTPTTSSSGTITISCGTATHYKQSGVLPLISDSGWVDCVSGTINVNLSEGSNSKIYWFKATAVSSTSKTVNAILDTANPNLVGTLTDGVTHNSITETPSLSWPSASDASSGVVDYEIAIGTTVGGFDILGWTSVGNVTSIQYNTGLSLTDGNTYYPSVRAVDNVGHTSTELQGDGWTVSLVAVSATYSGEPTSPSSITTLDVTVAGAGVTHYKYKVGVSGSTDCTNSTGYSADIGVATHITNDISGLADGTIKLCIVGKNASNTYQDYSSATTYTWTKDTTASGMPSGLSLNSPASSPDSDNTPTITVSGVSSGDTIKLYTDNACSTVEVGSGTAAGASINITTSTLSDGAYSFYSKATDAANNSSSCSTATVSYTVDTTAPTIPGSFSDNSIYFVSYKWSPIFTWVASTDATTSVNKYQLAIGTTSGGTEKVNWTDIGNVTSYQLTTLNPVLSTTYYASLRAVDAVGNISSVTTSDGWQALSCDPTGYCSSRQRIQVLAIITVPMLASMEIP